MIEPSASFFLKQPQLAMRERAPIIDEPNLIENRSINRNLCLEAKGKKKKRLQLLKIFSHKDKMATVGFALQSKRARRYKEQRYQEILYSLAAIVQAHRQLTFIINFNLFKISNNFCMNPNKFIVKLQQMMTESPQVISWSKDGCQLQIFDVERFSKTVHPIYFTTSNYKSFLRQLNMYNFKKMSKRKNSVSFRHPQFRRGNQEQFESIRRRQQKSNTRSNELLSLENRSSMEELLVSEQTILAPLNDHLIRQTLAQLKQEVSGRAMELVNSLETLIDQAIGGSSNSLQSKAEVSKQESLKEFASFGRMDELMQGKNQPFTQADYSYNFESHIFNRSEYY